MALSPLPVSFPSLSVRKDDYGDQKNIFKSVSGIVNAAQQAVQTIASNVNQSLYALATMLASASAPTAASTGFQNTKGVFWHDTGTNTIWLRDQADANWMKIASVDETNKQVIIGTPTGAVVPYAGSSSPSGWLVCDGSAVSRTTYSALFSAIGTIYGSGDGSTTFNLPDLRGRVVAGFDNANATGRLTNSTAGGVSANTLGNNGGEQAHGLSTAELASHSHSVSGNTGTENVSHTHSYTAGDANASNASYVGSGTGAATFAASSTGTESANHTHSFSATSSSVGSGTAHNNVQPTIIMTYIIKT